MDTKKCTCGELKFYVKVDNLFVETKCVNLKCGKESLYMRRT